MYHFASKLELLAATANTLRETRATRRVEALTGPPTKALDQLWRLLLQEVADGDFALWIGLLGHRQLAHQARESAAVQQQLVTSTVNTFRLLPGHPAVLGIPAMLDGLQLQLLQGRRESEVRELYDGFWLEVLDAAATV